MSLPILITGSAGLIGSALVDTLTAGSATRFLIITHNSITMARMDRLYGVTMEEAGVSELVSVDLARAEGLREVG